MQQTRQMDNRPSPSAAPGLGIALMIAALSLLPMVDGMAKHLSATHSPLLIGWARYAAACVFVLPVAIARNGRSFMPRGQIGLQLLRTVLVVGAMTCYFIAVSRVPLATAISGYFIGPVAAMVLAVLLLGERVTVSKAASLVFGFAGMLIIVRPGSGIEPGILWAVAAGCLYATYLVATRRTALSSDALKTLTFQCLVGTLLLTPQAVWAWSPLAWSEIRMFLAMGALSAASHALSIVAFRYAEASLLAPLVYIELLGSVAVGYLAFGDFPDAYVWIGAAAIILGGLILVRRKDAAAPAPGIDSTVV